MTSLLAFAWKKTSCVGSAALNEGVQDNTPGLPPDVTASSSGDTATGQPNDNPPLFGGHVRSPASTPEGLRPRKSADAICQELNIRPNVQQRLEWRPRSFEQQNTSVDPYRNMTSCLPPMASFNPPPVANTNDQSILLSSGNIRKVATSPQISTSSFYSRSSVTSNRQVAESPNLKVGQAKTAVGALLAMSDARVSFHETTKAPALPPNMPSSTANNLSVLPPRSWIDDNEGIDEEKYDEIDDDEDSKYSSDLSYHALNTSTTNLTPSQRKRKAKQVYSSSPETSTDNSSLRASPSSKNDDWRRWQYENGHHQQYKLQEQPQKDEEDEHGWLASESMGAETYDFQNIVDQDLFLSQGPDQDVNVSAISQSTMQREHDKSLEDSILHDDYAEREEERTYFDQYRRNNMDDDVMGNALRRQKIRNERRLKEDLLVATTERLQDDTRLVVDVLDGMRQQKGKLHHSMQLLDREGIFTGFAKATRESLIRNIDAILKEMTTASPEEFFLSPSQIPEIEETHDDLQQALSFCLALVKTAVPPEEQELTSFPDTLRDGHKWKCLPGFRSCLGLEEIPESPETIRGGDTSLFSLPSESVDTTPHTSNVSLTTTITSAYSPAKIRRPTMMSGQQQQDGTRLLRTLEAVATLFGRLGQAFTKLLQLSASTVAEPSTLRATEDIKRIYLQLQSIPSEDLKALIDAFELNQQLPPLHISRIVSNDFDDPQHTNTPKQPRSHHVTTMCLPPPPPSIVRSNDPNAVSSSHWLVPYNPDTRDRNSSQLPSMENESKMAVIGENQQQYDSNANSNRVTSLFSPMTEDMNSIGDNCVHVIDDLRRTVGSFEDQIEGERDEPPPGQSSSQSPLPNSDHHSRRRRKKKRDFVRNQPVRVMVSE